MVITALEVKALVGVIDSEFRDGNHPVNHPVWNWSANPFESKRTFPAVVASLSKKGLLTTDGLGGKKGCIALTQAGFDALKTAAPQELASRGLLVKKASSAPAMRRQSLIAYLNGDDNLFCL